MIHVMSADPYLRSGCKSEEKGGAVPRPMAGFVVGSIVASKSPNWKDGDMFGGSLPFCTVQVVKAAAVAGLWNLGKLPRDKASLGIGVLGMPGSTASVFLPSFLSLWFILDSSAFFPILFLVLCDACLGGWRMMERWQCVCLRDRLPVGGGSCLGVLHALSNNPEQH